MKTSTTRRFLGTAAATLCVAAAGCAGSGSATAEDTVYIGVAVGLKSPERYVNVFKGVQMALDELNAERGERPMLALRRAPENARDAADVALAFRDDPLVVGVVGHTESDATISAAPIYADRANRGRRAMVAVSPVAGATKVTLGNEWIFRAGPIVPRQAQGLARFAADSLGLREIGIIYRNDDFGKEFVRTFTTEFARDGGRVVGRDPFREEIAEFGAYAKRLVRRQVPSIVLAANARDEIDAIAAVRVAGGSPVVLGFNPIPRSMLEDPAVARALEGVQVYTINFFLPDRPMNDRARRFVRDFEQRFGERPDHWAALGYDAAMVVGMAVHEAGPDRKAIRDRVAEVGRSRPAYDGVAGEIRFDEEGDPIEKAVPIERVRL
jgi:branched-chain amino acid transport system substrate-binding protein